MNSNINGRGVLYEENIQLGPFPTHRMKRVDKPTTIVTDDIPRFKASEEAYMKALSGELGPAVQKAAKVFMPDKYPLSKAQWEVLGRMGSCRPDEVAPERAPIPDNPKVLSRHIKRLGYFLGADIMGICRLPEYAVFADDYSGNPIEVDFENAIVIVTRKEHETTTATTGKDYMGDPMSFRAYLPVALYAEVIASYIKKLGYDASPESMAGGIAAHHQTIGDTSWYHVIIPPLLLWAGIGEVSRTHMILNPFLGPSFKASAVLTNLPLEPDKPIDFGLQDFCQNCLICADACPVNAISRGDKEMYNGYETWHINERRCMSFLLQNPHGDTCNMCTKVCPWSRPNTWFDDSVRWAVSRSALARKIAIKWDSFFGRSRQDIEKKWWFDIHYEGDVLKPVSK